MSAIIESREILSTYTEETYQLVLLVKLEEKDRDYEYLKKASDLFVEKVLKRFDQINEDCLESDSDNDEYDHRGLELTVNKLSGKIEFRITNLIITMVNDKPYHHYKKKYLITKTWSEFIEVSKRQD